MARFRPGVGIVLALLAVGCHAWRKGVLVVQPPAGSGAVMVSGDVEQPITLPVSPRGVSLRTAIEAVRVKGNAAESNPGSTYAHIVRPEGDYYVSLSLVTGGGADGIRLRPDDSVRVVAWEKTDLARGLAEVVPAVPLRPAADDDLVAIDKWIRALFPEKKIPKVRAEDLTAAKRFQEVVEEYFANLEDQLQAYSHPKPQLTAVDNEDEEKRRKWLRSAFVPYFVKVAEVKDARLKSDTRLRRYAPDWAYLSALYLNRPRVSAGSSELVPITATFLAPGETNAIAANLLTVKPPANPAERQAGGHPTFNTYFQRLTALPDPGVVRVVRVINGKPTEFIMELITSQANWGLSGRNREQDYARLHGMLIFDDDVVEVTTLGRITPVLESVVLEVLETQRRR